MGVEGRVRSWRAVALLAPLVGLLAMHGLGGAQHHTLPSARATTDVAAQHVGHAVHEALAVTGDRLTGACHDCLEPGAAALCIAVLTSVAFGLLAAARARARRAEPVGALGMAGTVRAPPLRFDLVADLCVSRT